uniref:Coiled-coil and C2 domain-containing protein 1A n=1 Tax=Pogona vitticeps TaxID=103695 RepID=A0ABM5FQD1_9SAUR
MNRNKKLPPPPPRGGKGNVNATPRQIGLLVDLSPDGVMVNDGEDDHELEAELLALVGGQPDMRKKPNGKTPLPMEAIERMAAFCMKDSDEEDGEEEDDLEDDDELLAELHEVLEEDVEVKDVPVLDAAKTKDGSAGSSGMESLLEERLAMYKTAVANAKQAGESSKVRRYERGLKTLENLLTSVKKGKKIDDGDIPPPVATGKSRPSQQASPLEAASPAEASTPEENAPLSNHLPPESPSEAPEQPPSKSPPVSDLPPKQPPPVLPKPKTSPAPPVPVVSPEAPPDESPPSPSSSPLAPRISNIEAVLQARQRAYKLAALRAKQEGNIEMATKYYRIAKMFDPVLISVGKGETVDLSSLPPPPDQLSKEMLSSSAQQPPASTATPPPSQAVTPPAPTVPSPGDVPPPPRDMMEALQQRMDRYKAAAAQAKSKGDDRKARMHERIVKQYQDAIRAHKAGKPVEFADLPVPPGFPPIQGMESSPADQSLSGILETAMKLANEEEEGAEETNKPEPSATPSKPVNALQPNLPHQPASRAVAPAAPKSAAAARSAAKVSTRAQQQLAFLENRKKQLMQAALRAKQQNDIEGAKLFLRQAKGLDPMIEASQNGLPVDITKVPQAPVNKEDFTLVQRRGTNISSETAAQYTELVKMMRQQHEMCMNYSKQFTHLGNIAETTKFEKMAEECKKNMEILKQAHAKGFPLPKYHYEQRTFNVVKIFPELNSNDMVLSIVRGVNLPAPPGMSPSDLDAFVRFEFPYPNAEEAQKDKTAVIKNSNAPEFQEKFKLFINRGHRGLKRAIQTKGIKFEVVHKGGLFKTDRVVGVAQLKLEALETACEIREILELLDGRRPTGGKLEVIVRLREPLTSQQLETTTEKWLVIDPLTVPPVALPKPKAPAPPRKDVGSSKTVCTLHSFNVLAFDQERLEKKMLAYKQAGQRPPSDLLEQHQNIIQMIQWQKSQLQHGGPAVKKEYLTQLERYQQWYTEAARRLGSEGKREAAKDALYKRNLVECELQKFRR